jgi:hypothetical protein
MEEVRNSYKYFFFENLKGRDNLEDQENTGGCTEMSFKEL